MKMEIKIKKKVLENQKIAPRVTLLNRVVFISPYPSKLVH